tara:strand:+ start:3549 stop:4571 length:1023 start_codon:yes stop_codon:yes gene_type:complete
MNVFKNIFKTGVEVASKETTVSTPVEEVYAPVIDSAHIKRDMESVFEEALRQFDLSISKDSEVQVLKDKLESFKLANAAIYNKIEILKSVGLTSTPTAKSQLAKLEGDEGRHNKKIENLLLEINSAEKLKTTAETYSAKYPGYKFISKEVMISIMKKYNLVMGEACTYSKEIPDESLSIISKFKDQIEDSKKVYQLSDSGYGSYSFVPLAKEIAKEEVDWQWQMNKAMMLSRGGRGETVLGHYELSDFKMVAPESHFKIPIMQVKSYSSRSESEDLGMPVFVYGEDRIYRFNQEALDKVNKKNIEVLDPIACLEVGLGYIVMCAWDEEADIPEIQNELLN